MDSMMQSNFLKKPSKTVIDASQLLEYVGKQKEILDAAHYVISERGTKNATITAIAKRAGVVDSVIYHYFKNKEDVIFSVLDLQLQQAIEELKNHFKGIIGPVSQLGKMVWYHLSMNDRGDTQMRKNMLLECRSHRNFPEHKGYQTLLAYIGIMDIILKRCVDEGYFRPSLNIPLVRTTIFGLLDEEGLMSLKSDGPKKTLADFDAIMNLILAMTAKDPEPSDSNGRPEKYNRILKAAKHLFAEKGYKKATMAEVAALAGVAEGTIYEYFKNKQDLLLSITKEYFSDFKNSLDKSFVVVHPTEKLRWLMWRHFLIFASDGELVSVFLKETKLKKYFYEDEAHDIFVRYHDKICEVIDEGKAAGVFRPEINTRVFRNMVMGALAVNYNRWYFRTPIHSLDYMTELHEFIDLICRAAASPVPFSG